MAPPCVPAAVGVNVTEMVQFADAASDAGQLLLCAYCVLLEEMELTASAMLPVLVRVNVCAALVAPTAWLPKSSDVVESVATAPLPMPVRAIVCGVFGALSTIETVPVRVFAPPGTKAIVSVQFAPALRLLPQLFVTVYSLLALMLLMASRSEER